jgi:hypothetical protein
VASRGTTAAFIKAGCNHIRTVNRPNFSLSTSNLVDIPAEALSIDKSSSLKSGQRAAERWLETNLETYLTKFRKSLYLYAFFYIFSLLHSSTPLPLSFSG